MATKKFTRKSKSVAPTLFDETSETPMSAEMKKLTAERDSALAELQGIVDRVADTRIKFVLDSFTESGVLSDDALKNDEVVKGIFKLWRTHIANIKVGPGDDYFRLKTRLLEVFGQKEFDYWLYNDYRYMHQITWLILKSTEFCKLYKINRRKTLSLMAKCGWDYIMTNFNPKDGWKAEIDIQAEKFRSENPALFTEPDMGRAYAGLLDHSKTEFDIVVGGEDALIYNTLAKFSKREISRSDVHTELAELYDSVEDINWVINTYIDEWQHDLAGYVAYLLADEEEVVEDEPTVMEKIEKAIEEVKEKKSRREKIAKETPAEKVKSETIKTIEKMQTIGKNARSKKGYTVTDVTKIIKDKKVAEKNAPAVEYFKGRKLAKFIKTADYAYEYEAGDQFMIDFLTEENFTKASAERLVEEMVNMNKRQYKKFLDTFQTRLTTVRGKVQFK